MRVGRMKSINGARLRVGAGLGARGEPRCSDNSEAYGVFGDGRHGRRKIRTALGTVGGAGIHADGAAAGQRRRSGGAAFGILCRRSCRLHVRQRQRHLGRSDRHCRGRRRHRVRRFLRRRAGGLRAVLSLAPDAGHRARRLVPERPGSIAGPVLPRDRHRHGERAARMAGVPARPRGIRHGIVDAVRERRHRLGEHALLAHRPHDRQRGRQPQQHPAGLRSRRRRRLSPRSALVGARRVSLHQPRVERLQLRLGAGALRFAIRPASLSRRR